MEEKRKRGRPRKGEVVEKKPKGPRGGARPGAGAKKGERRRQTPYDGMAITITLCSSELLLMRLKEEAQRKGVSQSYVFSEWLKTLPECITERTEELRQAYLRRKALKKH